MNIMDKTFNQSGKSSETIIDDRTLRALQADFAALRNDIDALKTTMVDRGQRVGETAAENLELQLKELSARVDQAVGEARNDVERHTENVRDTVRENPLSSVGGAMAVGMIIGRLFARR